MARASVKKTPTRVVETRVKKPIDICGQRYRIVIYSVLECQGFCDYDEGVIRLRRSAPDRMMDTLLHEVLHGIFEASGLGWLIRSAFKLTKARFDSFEEDMIRLLAPSLLSTLRNAGWLHLPRLPASKRHRRA